GPEHEVRGSVRDQARAAGALHYVKGGGKERATAKGEDDQVGMYRADTPEAEPGQVEIECRRYQLGSEDDAHQRAHVAPDQRHDGEMADDDVVVTGLHSGDRSNGEGAHDYLAP